MRAYTYANFRCGLVTDNDRLIGLYKFCRRRFCEPDFVKTLSDDGSFDLLLSAALAGMDDVPDIFG